MKKIVIGLTFIVLAIILGVKMADTFEFNLIDPNDVTVCSERPHSDLRLNSLCTTTEGPDRADLRTILLFTFPLGNLFVGVTLVVMGLIEYKKATSKVSRKRKL